MKASAKSKKLSVRERAIGLLARREHSRQELQSKLLNKGFLHEEIEIALDSLEKKGWLSDLRFAESWIRHRIQGGYGRYRILSELSQKGVDSGISEKALAEQSIDWFELAKQTWCKKYLRRHFQAYSGNESTVDATGVTRELELPRNSAILARQKRFLQSRGFSNDEIAAVFDAKINE